VIAHKFLRAGAVGMFGGLPWPVPEDGRPGAWVGGDGHGHGHGVHACRADELPLWITDELWVVELAEPVRARPAKLTAPRGRLLARVDAWDGAAADAFAAACARRTRALAAATGDPVVAGFAGDAEALCAAVPPEPGRARAAAVAGLIAAEAGARAGGPDGASAERARPVAWFLRLLLDAPVLAGDAAGAR